MIGNIKEEHILCFCFIFGLFMLAVGAIVKKYNGNETASTILYGIGGLIILVLILILCAFNPQLCLLCMFA